ncbi:MAG: site-specific integrase [Acidimicrobiales bacterium]
MAPNRRGSVRRRGARFQARYQDPAGRQHSATFGSERQAERWVADQLAPVTLGGPKPSGAPSLAEWSTTWLAEVAHLRPSTFARASSAVRAQLVPAFGTLPIDAITAADVRRWVARLVNDGLAPATVTRSLRVLGSCLQVAADDGLIPTNPARGIRPPQAPRHEQRYLTPAQVARLADTIDQRYRGLIHLAAYGGLRIGELAGLRVGRVDLSAGTVQVVEQVVEVAGTQHFGPPKTAAGRRTVPVPRFVLDELVPLCEGKAPDELVFTAPGGGTLRRTIWAARFFRPAVERADLIPLRIHDLRHTAVGLWIAAGANTLEITRRAGHSSSAFVLDRYGHLLDPARSETTDRLEEMARGAAG